MLRTLSLKRKASFSSIPTPDMTPVVEGPSVTMDDAPHLNSRTRKRFRDDRPEEKIVYENTLRWLYSAQQRQESATINTNTEDENENVDSEPLPTPETIDPRQQTLHRFFKSAPSSAPSSSHHTTRQSTGPIQTDNAFFQPYSHNMNSSTLSMGSDDNRSPSSRFMGADMDMDVDSGSDQSLESKGGAGGFRWM